MPAAVVAFLIAWGPYIAVSVVTGAVIAGATYAISAALAPGAPQTPAGTLDRLRSMRRGTVEAARIAYGRVKTSGVMFYARSMDQTGVVGTKGKVLHLGLAIAEGPIDAIEEIYLNDDRASASDYVERVGFIPMLGWPDQPPLVGSYSMGDAGVLTLPSDWVAKHRPLAGIAYVWCILRHSLTVFPAGAPVVLVRFRGRVLYDPRLDVSRDGFHRIDDRTTWSWSQNWALVVRDFLVDRRDGMKIPPERICEECLIEAADRSDDLVVAPSEGLDDLGQPITHRRYTVDGVWETNVPRLDVLSQLKAAGAGDVLFYDGLYHIKAGVAEPIGRWPNDSALGDRAGQPIVLDENDLRGDTPFSVVTQPTRVERVNEITGKCMDPVSLTMTAFPAVTHAMFARADKLVRYVQEIELPWVQHVDRARRIASIMLVKARLAQRITWPAMPGASVIVPGVTVRVTLGRYGWVNKEFRVIDRTVDQSGATDLILAEYDAGEGDDPGGIFTFPIDPTLLPPPTTLQSPFRVSPPADLSLSLVSKLLPDGSRSLSIGALITPPPLATPSGYRVRWYTMGTATQSLDTTELYVELPVNAEGLWTVTAQSLALGVPSVAISRTISVLLDPGPPPSPIDFRVTPGEATIRLSWTTERAPSGLVTYMVRAQIGGAYGADPLAEWDSALPVWVGTTTSVTIGATTLPLTLYVRTQDTLGRWSDNVAWLTYHHVPVDSTVVAARNFRLEGWPLGYLSGGVVNDFGEVESRLGGRTWDFGGGISWDDAEQWASLATGAVIYLTPVLDLGRDTVAHVVTTIEARIGDTQAPLLISYRVRSNEDEQFSEWHTLGPTISGRQVQFYAITTSTTGAPLLLREFSVRLTADMAHSIVNDWAQPDHQIVFSREENSAKEWRLGDQAKVAVAQGRLTLDWPAAVDLDEDARIVRSVDPSPDDDMLILQGEWTIEFRMKLDSLNSSPYLMRKGTGWTFFLVAAISSEAQYNYIAFEADGMPSLDVLVPDTKRYHHYAFVARGGAVMAYVDGEIAPTLLTFVGGPDRSWPLPLENGTLDTTNQGGSFVVGGEGFEAPDVVLDYVRIWQTARSVEDLRTFSNFPVRSGLGGLALEWALDEVPSPGLGTTVVDTGPWGYHGVLLGAAQWVRAGWRESPPIDLGLFPDITGVSVEWGGSTPAGTSIEVEASVDDGQSWQPITEGVPRSLSGVAGNGQGRTLRIRQWLYANSTTAFPAIDYVKATIVSRVGAGDVVVPLADHYAYVAATSIRAIQSADRYVGSWETVARDPLGARFRVRDGSGQPYTPPLVDVDFFGIRAT